MKAKKKVRGQVLKLKTSKNSTYYLVESNVKLPAGRIVEDFVKDKLEFPYKSMKVGDSFVIPAKENNTPKRSKMYYEAKKFRNEVNPKFAIVTRQQKDESRRIWRYK